MVVNDTGMATVGGFKVVTAPYIPKGHIAFMAEGHPGVWQLVTPEGVLKLFQVPDPTGPLELASLDEVFKPANLYLPPIHIALDLAKGPDTVAWGEWLDHDLQNISHLFEKPSPGVQGVMGPSCNIGSGVPVAKDPRELSPDECLAGVADLLK